MRPQRTASPFSFQGSAGSALERTAPFLGSAIAPFIDEPEGNGVSQSTQKANANNTSNATLLNNPNSDALANAATTYFFDFRKYNLTCPWLSSRFVHASRQRTNKCPFCGAINFPRVPSSKGLLN